MRKLRRSALVMAWCVVVAFTGVLVAKGAPPPLPQAFFGSVQFRGQPAAIGTPVEARGQGVLVPAPDNPVTVTVAGQYGGAGPMLLVQGTLTDGTPLTFYVNGVAAKCAPPGQAWQDTYPFTSGALTQLDLKVDVQIWLPLIVQNLAR